MLINGLPGTPPLGVTEIFGPFSRSAGKKNS